MPITRRVRSPRVLASQRMPPALPAAVCRSLGHLRRTCAPKAASACATATPATSARAPRAAGRLTSRANEAVSEADGVDTQTRWRRPRPPVCRGRNQQDGRAAGACRQQRIPSQQFAVGRIDVLDVLDRQPILFIAGSMRSSLVPSMSTGPPADQRSRSAARPGPDAMPLLCAYPSGAMIDGLHSGRRPPALVRLLWLAVTAAIAYLSLYPLADWRLRQPSPFAFLTQGLPRYYSPTDLASNIAVYVVFGLLFSLGWSSRRHWGLTALLALVAGVVLSLSLESLQSYLPRRVPSLLDFSANAAGSLVGGAIGAAVAHYRIRPRRGPAPVSNRWYEEGPAIGWALALVWVISQLPTQRLLFSTGNLQAWLPETLPQVAQWLPAFSAGLQELLPEPLRAAHETATVATMMCVLGVLVMDLVRSAGWRMTWIAGLMAAAVALRILSSPPFQSSQRLLVLMTSGAQGGLLLGALALYLVGAFRRRTRLRMGVALVVLGLVLVNVSPTDPFFQATQSAAQGLLTPAMTPSLRSLINGIGALWPVMALAYFAFRLAATRRKRPDKGAGPGFARDTRE